MLRSVIQYSSTRTVLQYTRATFASSACRTAAKANQGVGSDDGSVPAPRKAGRPRKSVVEGEVRRPPGRPPKPLGVEFAAEAPKKPGDYKMRLEKIYGSYIRIFLSKQADRPQLPSLYLLVLQSGSTFPTCRTGALFSRIQK